MNATRNRLQSQRNRAPRSLDELPALAEARQPEDESAAAAPPPVRKILLVDDDRGVRELLGRLLETERYEVMTARTGREAIAKFSASRPDLVLLDLNMPDKDGWEAFAGMCQSNPLVPVIVITARPGQHALAIELGIDALMEKPLNFGLLLETVRSLLAETEVERTRRLSNPDFKTRFLNPPRRGPTLPNNA